MKKIIILLILSAFAMSMTAQDSLKKVVSGNRFQLKKNEFGLNIAPVAGYLINTGRGGDGGTVRLSISYKRYLNEHIGLRVLLVGYMVQNDRYNFWGEHGQELFILKNDTTLVRQRNVSSSYWRPHLNLGYEYVFGKRERLKWFYGADLTVGYSKRKSEQVIDHMDNDTTSGQQGWVATIARDELLSATTIEAMSVGVSPFFGTKYILSKHFSVSAQVGFDFTYQDQKISETGVNGNKRMHVSSFDFNQDTGIINDISLIYRF